MPPASFTRTLPLIGQDQMADALPAGCVIIDFSLAAALDGLLDQARRLGAPLVVGTTGFSSGQQEKLRRLFATGIPGRPGFATSAWAFRPCRCSCSCWPAPCRPVSTPSRWRRITSPSWTNPAGPPAPWPKPTPRSGAGNPADPFSQRLGGVIGEHTWTFSDQEETLVVTHRAHSRQAFLRGILPSVRFVHERRTGVYNLTDVCRIGRWCAWKGI